MLRQSICGQGCIAVFHSLKQMICFLESSWLGCFIIQINDCTLHSKKGGIIFWQRRILIEATTFQLMLCAKETCNIRGYLTGLDVTKILSVLDTAAGYCGLSKFSVICF